MRIHLTVILKGFYSMNYEIEKVNCEICKQTEKFKQTYESIPVFLINKQIRK